jgi:hypothetical protein
MAEERVAGLRVVDGLRLRAELRAVLRPGEEVADPGGIARRLPRWFLEVESWEQALATPLAPHFGAYELLDVDAREAEAGREYPRYLPLASLHLAAALELFRREVGAPVRIACNGGYRTPAHALSVHANPHAWGTAANLYRVGDDFLDGCERIERHARTLRTILPGVWVRSCGRREGEADDQLHLDLGYLLAEPRQRAPEARR